MATEEPVVANEVVDEPAVAELAKAEENPPAKSAKSKKEPKAKKPAAPKKKTAPAHPPYFEVIDNSTFTFLNIFLFSFVNVRWVLCLGCVDD